MTDDITFCASDCHRHGCYRHPSNIRRPELPHSYANFGGTADCPCHTNTIEICICTDCASWGRLVIDLQKVAELAGRRAKDEDGVFYTDWTMKQAKRLCKLIAEYGSYEQHEMCHAWFSTNNRLMKVWLDEYSKRKMP